ncbi:DEAD/DEAH box helicase family protein [Spiractinospora alimapuensis]|uniref:DEAD/DEAH box helicase family protein n=1 Tax=Spiractinospora alimapuensis TaxID=2820884 RepID=UPI001F176AF7|nr:DEAD/DEAH box helicase family protein [Spiractinospora alimapuensis]QVQ54068.1 DEAD/DEAH box helicase family protein [Spiractinospora alimapuensis]
MSSDAGDIAAGLAAARWDPGFRDYQERVLDELAARWESGTRRAWVVLPPGAGKTVVGLEAARRLGHATVVLTPNSAIQSQWISHWRSFSSTGPEIPAGTDRDLHAPITVLTYQSLAVFDPDSEDETNGARPDGEDEPAGSSRARAHRSPTTERLLRRLHPNGAALVERLHAAGPVTLVLDECHHLAQVWGRLLREILQRMPEARVIGLTGTPAENLNAQESELVSALFDQPIAGPSVPALVREGYLAPFAELTWLTQPTAVEHDYLRSEAERFTELCTDLMDPAFVTPGFLEWLERRLTTRALDGATAGQERVSWSRISAEEPELADAALRLHHVGRLALPDGARPSERHRRAPDADDWVALLSDYLKNCLAGRADEDQRTTDAVERIRSALPATGYRLTRQGVRKGRSAVDRLLARSEAKARGVVEIAALERASLEDRLRLLVLCDHERAPARSSARLGDVLRPEAGSAIRLLDLLSDDERTLPLHPLLVTGRTVAGTRGTLDAFRSWIEERTPSLELEVEDEEVEGLAALVGRWTPRTWVRLATAYFEAGHTRLLVGTRALLGEGWDARRVTTVVDLTTATTSTAVTQSRGRALRLDPSWPEKVAHTWTVACVAPEHPKGAADWSRLARKYQGFLGVDRSGAVTEGVAQVDSEFSSFTPPPAEDFDGINARMIARAEDRPATRALWRVGDGYDDVTRVGLSVRLPRTHIPTTTALGTSPRPAGLSSRTPTPPPLVPAERGFHVVRPPARPAASGPAVTGALLGGVLAAVLAAFTSPAEAVVWGALLAGCAALILGVGAPRVLRRRHQSRYAQTHASLAAGSARGPDVIDIAWAVADSLQRTGHCARGPDSVRLEVDPQGVYRVVMHGATPEESTLFSEALDDALGPITGRVRYLIPRFEAEVTDEEDAGRQLLASLRGDGTANRAIYHKVPEILARHRRTADIYARSWTRWVSRADAVHTGGEEGAALLFVTQGTSPLDLETTRRLVWT